MLRVLQESGGIEPPGQALLELGSRNDLQAEIRGGRNVDETVIGHPDKAWREGQAVGSRGKP
jgi:hypothetical protein